MPQGPDQWLRLLSRKSAVFWWERDLSWSLQGLHERYPISQADSQTLTLLLGCLDSCQFFWVFLTLFASWRSLWRSGCAQHRKLFIPLHLLYDILCVSVDRSAGALCVRCPAFRLYHDGRKHSDAKQKPFCVTCRRAFIIPQS